MKELHTYIASSDNDLRYHINARKVPREDIVAIVLNKDGRFVVFYYCDHY